MTIIGPAESFKMMNRPDPTRPDPARAGDYYTRYYCIIIIQGDYSLIRIPLGLIYQACKI